MLLLVCTFLTCTFLLIKTTVCLFATEIGYKYKDTKIKTETNYFLLIIL